MEARKRFAALAQGPEDRVPLAEAALWIAAEEYEGLDVPAYLRRLDAIGLVARERLAPTTGLDASAETLNRLLFEEVGLRGNREEYYDPRNSFLNDVLDRRLGIPITLSVVYIEVAARAGVTVHGVGLPGHFVVRLERHGATRLLDVFNGGTPLTEMDCRALVGRALGPDAPLEPARLEPVASRLILARMLGNLKGIYVQQRDWGRALGTVERLLLLRPHSLQELRDRGLIHAHLGGPIPAIRDLEAYLRGAPAAQDAEQVRARVRTLRHGLAALN